MLSIHRTRFFLSACLLGLMAANTAAAQAPEDDPTEYENLYRQEEQVDYDDDRFAIAVGAGIVLPEDALGRDDGEIYYSAAFRWRLRGRETDEYRRRGRRDDRGGDYNERHNNDHYRGQYPGGSSSGGIRGFLEPEIGYWKKSDGGRDIEDTLIGLNLVGVVPTRFADFFLGVGFAAHQLDGVTVDEDGLTDLDLSETRIGGNVQVGVELYVSEGFGVFGTGRLDILEDQPFDRQTKVWGGLRWHF